MEPRLILAIVTAVFTVQSGFAVSFEGSNGDGFAIRSLSNTTLTGQNLNVLYDGSNGDGFAIRNLSNTTLSGQSLNVLYDGSNGDGFAIRNLSNTTLVGQNLNVLYDGSNGDGFAIRSLSNTTLVGQNLNVLYVGSNGDGFAIRNLSNTTLSGQSLNVLYDGSNGDGFDLFTAFGITPQGITDSDGDLIPDDFENLYTNALNPGDPSDANEDFDGDGESNLEEYYADTNPEDPNSFFEVLVRKIPLSSNYELYYDTKKTRFYRFETSTDLNVWDESRPWNQGSNTEETRTLPSNPKSFGRIRVRP